MKRLQQNMEAFFFFNKLCARKNIWLLKRLHTFIKKIKNGNNAPDFVRNFAGRTEAVLII